MDVKPGDVVRCDFGLPEGAEPTGAALWELRPLNYAAARFEDDNRLHPIVSVGRKPGVVALTGSVRAKMPDGGFRMFHRHLTLAIEDPDGGVEELRGEVDRQEGPQEPARGRRKAKADPEATEHPEPAPTQA